MASSASPEVDRWTAEPGELSKTKIDKKLAPGSYWFALSAGENRKFGANVCKAAQRDYSGSRCTPTAPWRSSIR